MYRIRYTADSKSMWNTENTQTIKCYSEIWCQMFQSYHMKSHAVLMCNVQQIRLRVDLNAHNFNSHTYAEIQGNFNTPCSRQLYHLQHQIEWHCIRPQSHHWIPVNASAWSSGVATNSSIINRWWIQIFHPSWQQLLGVYSTKRNILC